MYQVADSLSIQQGAEAVLPTENARQTIATVQPSKTQETVVVQKAVAVPSEERTMETNLDQPADTLEPVAATDTLNEGAGLYESTSFFDWVSSLKTEAKAKPKGIEGSPVPYSLANDSLVTGLLLASLLITITIFSATKKALIHSAKNFFRLRGGNSGELNETSTEIRLQFYLVLQTCLLFALLAFFYTREQAADFFILNNYQIIGIYTATIAAYFLTKLVLYTIVNNVFFQQVQAAQWLKTFLLLAGLEGILAFPLVLMQIFVNVSLHFVYVYLLAILVFVKILSVYKIYSIFFQSRNAFLQIILYLCALEIVPVSFLWGVLMLTNNYLKVNI